MKKTWGGRFSQGADPAAERFTGSLAFDQRLWPQDIAGSIAHRAPQFFQIKAIQNLAMQIGFDLLILAPLESL